MFGDFISNRDLLKYSAIVKLIITVYVTREKKERGSFRKVNPFLVDFIRKFEYFFYIFMVLESNWTISP